MKRYSLKYKGKHICYFEIDSDPQVWVEEHLVLFSNYSYEIV